MHLLASLNSGFQGAANGYAGIYIRGTTTRATIYGDFEASTSDSSGANITLDAYGSALVYVNQLVDVKVYDSTGTLVRDYCDGYASPNVEVVSPAFTGTDYVTALSAVSEPTTLQAVLNLWNTNAGGPDWKVDIGGVDTTLLVALGALNGLVFNVKSPAYGAVGDGVTNDQSAIQAALAAAVAAGGGFVFFPKGTYRISTAIEWDHKVSIIGAGANLSTITTDSASNARILTWTAGSGQPVPIVVYGLSFTATQSNSGDQVYSSVAANAQFINCYFNVSTNCIGQGLNWAGASSKLTLVGCRFNGNASVILALWYVDCVASVSRCSFVAVSTAYNATMVRGGSAGRTVVRDCVFDASAISSAAASLRGIELLGAAADVSGCYFLTVAIQFAACIYSAGGVNTASGNSFPATSAPYGGTPSEKSVLEMLGSYRDSGAGAAFTVPNGVRQYELKSTGTAPTITMPTGYCPGQTLCMLITNNTGAGWAGVTISGATSLVSVGAVAAGFNAYVDCIYADLTAAGTYTWWVIDARVG